ncbi:hypothetical protein BE04_14725 [Sorangium cellulosum]|uniref:Uncharacterized protein n=2 Tax=Sorangium cellulosum TaxID=56 RepID=A0A150QCW9_SORCE|nr:hypothetical protein [Sorangium cellulosum]AGP34516.1 hypothetical protein SCE1572_08360 [Sorangium cellulosum So0157-2]KYF65827.1 hypothetical protein BE04_14725 [Sorangium cellulosum]KYG06873.1 hypothetical protein BE21_32330 [Sorangium cellulosum]
MAHVLARLTGATLEDVKQQLAADAASHAEQGMHLEHIWTNDDDPGDILFLLRVDDLSHCKQLISRVHAEIHRDDPSAKLPHMTFLKEA